MAFSIGEWLLLREEFREGMCVHSQVEEGAEIH
jgi:hypothetical protein